MIVNREKLADVLGCALRTVDEYRRQGMPGDAPKRPGDQWRFDSAVVVEWIKDRERTDVLGEVSRVDEGEAKRRKLVAEAGIAEHELALKQKAAVSIADFDRAWQAMIGAARSRLLGVGTAVGPEVALLTDDHECAQAIHGAISEALQELSESITELPDDSERTAGVESAAEEAADPVGTTTGTDGESVGGSGAPVKRRVERKAR